jgi:hypothetical protein
MRVILKGFPYAAPAFIPADFKKIFASKYTPIILSENQLLPVSVTLIFPLIVMPIDVALVVEVLAIISASRFYKFNECYYKYVCEKRNYNLNKNAGLL